MATVQTKNPSPSYWESRQNLIYYRYVELIIKGIASDAHSIIDVGSSNTSCIEWFDWIPVRYALDLRTPYSSDKVKGIKADFLKFQPGRKFDIAVCLQVLEHIPKAGQFAQKLFQIADSVLISVPYNWPEGDCKYHVHDPVDSEKLFSWTQKKPDYEIIAVEPFVGSNKGKRLIAYYHGGKTPFSQQHARKLLS